MKTAFTHSFFVIFAALLVLSGCKKNNSIPPATPVVPVTEAISPMIVPVAPAIKAISPTSGGVGKSVTITGFHFGVAVADNTVKFNGTTAVITSASSNTLVAVAPAGATTGAVSVTTAGGTATGPVFTYLLTPTITAISPTSGAGGSAVTITGTNFDAVAANNHVRFNGVAATVTSATTTSLNVKVPPVGSSGAVTVTTTNGTGTGPVFTYLKAPVITTIAPATAAAGASVTITGTSFDATAANDVVKFNSTVATITTATVTQLVVKVPAGGTTGKVTVTTAGGTSNGVTFTYTTSTGPNVYVLGSDTRSGYGYWKNSAFTAIAACTSAYAMKGSGTDIYVAGPTSANVPTYWKNGTAVQLSAQTGYAYCIALSGTDVYCLGSANGNYYVWKNGTPTQLTGTTGGIGQSQGYYLNNTLTVSNGDTYVAGSQYLDFSSSSILKATYWKNGSPVNLTDGISTGSAWATAIAVSGSDVYVAGLEEVRSGGGLINLAPRLWKNGVSIPITTPANSIFNAVSSILVAGSNVYIGGQYNSAGALWKNGTMVSPATYALAENVSSIFLYTNILYVGGASSSSGNNCYWKNGVFVEMDPGCSGVSTNCAGTSANQVIGIYVK